ncbi:MAG: sulfatase [Firmicutes bacterium]|nr:sulfatase [Bacillota bacterium]MCM1400918.1 sulfatase [Bacteroides sp.]MCM1476571.1 sulfatase [Bacteroides sp.]
MLSSKKVNSLLCGIGTLSLFPSPTAAAMPSNAEQQRPNVLFIAVDDMKPWISPYGDTLAKTPAMDELASRGVTFDNAYCQVALSGPTRSSLLTGLNPDHTGVWWLMGAFRNNNPDIVTMPQALMNNGYETVGVGKIFHPLTDKKLKNDPQSWSRYVKTPGATYALSNGRVATECADVPDDGYQDGVITNEAIKAMKELKDGGKPFFLGVGYKKPHLPFCAPKKYWDMYNREDMPVAEYQKMSENPVEYAYHNSLEVKGYSDIPPFESYMDTRELDVETQKRLLHAYYACISYVDAQIGKLLEALDENGLADNTIIVLFGDHGYHLGDHGLWNKLTDFEQATRVPLIISMPGAAKGKHSSSVVEFLDIFPTICDLTSTPAPQQLDGTSLVPALKNPKKKVKDYAISQFSRSTTENYTIYSDTDLEDLASQLPEDITGYAIRDNRYRLVEWTKGFKTFVPFSSDMVIGYELYDYDKDPLETRNLANNPAYASVVKKLKSQLHKYYSKSYSSPMSVPIAKKAGALK